VQEHGRVERESERVSEREREREYGESRTAQIGDCASPLGGMSILGGGRAAERPSLWCEQLLWSEASSCSTFGV